jgi:hypothetical protein
VLISPVAPINNRGAIIMPAGGLPQEYLRADMAYRHDQVAASYRNSHTAQPGRLRRAIAQLRRRTVSAAAQPAQSAQSAGSSSPAARRTHQRPVRAIAAPHN